ncbi:MAG: chorismate synthase [Peptococcaceae bacterium]|nr:chorismate synthase [Peptococcaceae bacterium]
MSGTWGEYLTLSIFGESHGKCVGIVINGLGAGFELDLDFINKELQRRRPGLAELYSSTRQEKDEFEILSGYFNHRTTGAPLTCVIWNQDPKSEDYDEIKGIIRPGHADYTAKIKYSGFNDYRGGGHFSGRLTAPLVLAGAIAKQILQIRNVTIGSHILSIGEIKGESFNPVQIEPNILQQLTEQKFPTLDQELATVMKEKLAKVRKEQDSVGGVVETAIVGLPAGLGSPFFDSMESKLAHLLFSIPAVKGVEFGAGFAITQMQGSEANDEFALHGDRVVTVTNHSGGIQGGITNGMPVLFRTAFKPTPSIAKNQKTVDLEKMEELEISIKGRHDVCIVPRAVPVVEAVAAIAVLDLMLEKDGNEWIK